MDPCETCGRIDCPGAPRFKGLCDRCRTCGGGGLFGGLACGDCTIGRMAAKFARSVGADLRTKPIPLPFASELVLEPGQTSTIESVRPSVLYRPFRLRLDPCPREIVVQKLVVGCRNQLLGPTPAVVLDRLADRTWLDAIDISQTYEATLENVGGETLRAIVWFDGVYVE